MSIQECFGPNCSETATSIILDKNDLAAKVSLYMLDYHNDSTDPGYVASETNPFESTITSIIQSLALYFTQSRFDSAPENQILVEVPDAPQFFSSRWEFPITVRLSFNGSVPTLSPSKFD